VPNRWGIISHKHAVVLLFLACCLVKTTGKFGATVSDAVRGWLKLIYVRTLRSQVITLVIPYSSFIPPMLPVIFFFPVLFLRKPSPSLFFQIVRFFSHVTSSGQHFSHRHFFKAKDVLNFLFMKYRTRIVPDCRRRNLLKLTRGFK